MHVYWHILGDIADQNESEGQLEIVFEQRGERLRAVFQGFDRFQLTQAPHALFGKATGAHVFVHLVGNDIQSEFSLME